jgi:hypothetical protein
MNTENHPTKAANAIDLDAINCRPRVSNVKLQSYKGSHARHKKKKKKQKQERKMQRT